MFLREFRLWRIYPRLTLVSELPDAFAGYANPSTVALCARCWVRFLVRVPNTGKRKSRTAVLLFCVGDPYGNRTHVSALRGPCLSLLTNGPWFVAILLYYIFSGLSIAFLNFFLKIPISSFLYVFRGVWQKYRR